MSEHEAAARHVAAGLLAGFSRDELNFNAELIARALAAAAEAQRRADAGIAARHVCRLVNLPCDGKAVEGSECGCVTANHIAAAILAGAAADPDAERHRRIGAAVEAMVERGAVEIYRLGEGCYMTNVNHVAQPEAPTLVEAVEKARAG